MMYTRIVIILFFLSSFTVASQSVLKESSTLSENQLETELINLHEKCEFYYDQNTDSLLYFAEILREKAIKAKKPLFHVLAQKHIGDHYSLMDQYNKSFEAYNEAIEVALENKISQQAEILHAMGVLFHLSSDYNKALVFYERSIEASKLEANAIQQKKTSVNLGAIHSSLRDFEKAEPLLLYAIENNPGSDPNTENLAWSNLANSYLRQKQYEKAIPLLEANSKRLLSSGFLDEAMLSITYLIEAKIKNESNPDIDSLVRFCEQNIAKSSNLRNKSLIQESISAGFFALKKYKKAYIAEKKHMSLYDSFITIQNKNELYDLEIQYQSQQKENEIKDLKIESEKQSNFRNILIFIAISLIAVVAFFIYRNTNKNKTERILREKNEQVSKALSEKELLLKEIHHRVKNNLQTISSLLNLQSRYVDKEAKDAVIEGKNRVKSMGLIHQKLYQTDNLKGILFSDYLEGLADILFRSYGIQQNRIKFKTDIDPINLDVDTAVPLGLILNELISNSLKYAFPEEKEGEIEVVLKESNQKLNMIMIDSGVGISKDFDLENSTSFGMKLIYTLAEKLDASIKIDSTHGTRIAFEINNYKLAS